MDVTQLNQKFAIENHVKFITGKGGWPYVHLENNGSTAFVSLYGAHVLHYTPKGEKDVLWNSETSFFEQGKPIRGGIPVCWPWFGPHESDSSKPMHGFARLSVWDVAKTQVNSNSETELTLSLTDSVSTKALWPYSFRANIVVTLGDKLNVALKVHNTGSEPFTMTEALHTYFQVGNASKVTVEGLELCTYLDGLNQNTPVIQSEKLIEVIKEENRRYLNTTAPCIIADPLLGRKIRVEKQNSNTTVVWNPWTNTAKSMPDFDDEGYKIMVCVEAANAYSNAVTVEPAGDFTMATSLKVFR
jgi:D-hexose-6-phosphate mutarotase